MIEADIPANNEARVQAVESTGLLDTPIEERFEKIVRMACRTLHVPIASFVLVDHNRQWLKATTLESYELPLNTAFCTHTVAGEDLLNIPNAREDKRFFDNPLVTGNPHIAFYAGYPVRDAAGFKVGTFCIVDTKPRDLDADEKESLRDMASMIETELRASQLQKTQGKLIHDLDNANRRAMVDPLTRLWNRAGLSELVKREWAAAKRNHKEFVVVMGDIDHFKKINDTYGHPGGDAVLRTISRTLLSTLRTEDIIGRVGGEEFLMILTDCHKVSAMDTVERLRQAVERTAVTMDGKLVKATMSFGVASLVPGKDDVPAALISAADKALYRAKANGRNRIEAADASLTRRQVVGGDDFTYDIVLDL